MFWFGHEFGVCTDVCLLGIGFGFESMALVEGGVIRLLNGVGTWWAMH